MADGKVGPEDSKLPPIIVGERTLQTEGINSLVICPGHGIYVGAEDADAMQDSSWIGTFPGEGRFCVEHAQTAVYLASKDSGALLVFSGGQTRKAAGRVSEGQSYWQMSNQRAWFGHQKVVDRATTEDFARDSAENLQFSLLRFFQITRRIPDRITVCGWKFKHARYKLNFDGMSEEYMKSIESHVFPVAFEYLGVNNPQSLPTDSESRVIALYSADKLGRNTKEIQIKTAARDPFHRGGIENYEYLTPALKLALRQKATSVVTQKTKAART